MRIILSSCLVIAIVQPYCCASPFSLQLPHTNDSQPGYSSSGTDLTNDNPLSDTIIRLPSSTAHLATQNVSYLPGQQLWLQSARNALGFVQKQIPNAHLFRFFGNASQDVNNCSAQFYDWTQPSNLFTVQLPIVGANEISKQSNEHIVPQNYTLMPFWYLDPTLYVRLRNLSDARVMADAYLKKHNISTMTQDWELCSPPRNTDDDIGYNDVIYQFPFAGLARQTPHSISPAKLWLSSDSMSDDIHWVKVADPEAERKWEEGMWNYAKWLSWDRITTKDPSFRYHALYKVAPDHSNEWPSGKMSVLMYNGNIEKYVGDDGHFSDKANNVFPSAFKVENYTNIHSTYDVLDLSLVAPSNNDMLNFTTIRNLILDWQAQSSPQTNSWARSLNVIYDAYLLITPASPLKAVLAPDTEAQHIYYQFAFTSPPSSSSGENAQGAQAASPQAGSLFVEARKGDVYVVPGLGSGSQAGSGSSTS